MCRISRIARRIVSVVAIVSAWPLAALAHDQGYGFVWANDPSNPSYTPSSPYAYNDAGTPPRITRT